MWNILQTEFSCCGVTGPSDWHAQNTSYNQTKLLPESCCDGVKLDGGSCSSIQNSEIENGAGYEKGCLGVFTEFLLSKEGMIAGIVTIVSLIQIAVIVVTSHLLKKVPKPQTMYPFY